MNEMPCSAELLHYNAKRVDFVDQVKVMMRKEDKIYKCRDYILRRKMEDMNLSQESGSTPSESSESITWDESKVSDDEIDSSCRSTMCEWCYRVVDHFSASRELVEISMNYLDRFLDKFNCDRTAYKLAAITSMYLTIKLFNRKSLTMQSLSALSRGEFSAAHIAEMETVILQTLSWNLYPATAANFIFHYNALLPSIKKSAKQTILQRSCFFSELAVMEYSFVTLNPSTIAISSILNALEGLDVSLMSKKERNLFKKEVEDISGIDLSSKTIVSAREKIWVLYKKSAQFELHDSEIVKKETRESSETKTNSVIEDATSVTREMSPVCVSTEI